MPYWIFHFFSLHFVLEKNRFVSFRLISFRFVSFRLISFRFVSIGFVSFRLISFLFRFALYRYPFLIGLNRIFSTLPQSEYTSREVYSGLCLFLSIVYSVFQRCPTRDQRRDFISSRPIKLQKRWNFLKFQNISKCSYTNSKCSKNFKIIKYFFFFNP
jgi:hypothetical protein